MIMGYFLPSDPPKNTKSPNFEKMKKTGNVIILNLCTINDDHMMYGS